MLNELKKRLIEEEGWENKVYLDHLGHPTIGVGFNLDREDARARLRSIGVDYDAIKSGRAELTNEQVSTLLDEDIEDAVDLIPHLFPIYDDLPDIVQVVLLDMLFNMGFSRLRQFIGMKAAIMERDWNTAADEMLDSLWAKQVPNRANALASLMRSAKEA